MRIEAAVEDGISPQARTYAEYRVFAAVTQSAAVANVRDVRVELHRVDRDGGCENIRCTVLVVLDDSDSLRIRTIGSHAYAAINRAVDRIRSAMAAGAADRVSPDA
jgi:ribosome-associated translation inhibitor RaiA